MLTSLKPNILFMLWNIAPLCIIKMAKFSLCPLSCLHHISFSCMQMHADLNATFTELNVVISPIVLQPFN